MRVLTRRWIQYSRRWIDQCASCSKVEADTDSPEPLIKKPRGGYDLMPSFITCQNFGCPAREFDWVTGNDEIIMAYPQYPKASESMRRESSGCPKQSSTHQRHV